MVGLMNTHLYGDSMNRNIPDMSTISTTIVHVRRTAYQTGHICDPIWQNESYVAVWQTMLARAPKRLNDHDITYF